MPRITISDEAYQALRSNSEALQFPDVTQLADGHWSFNPDPATYRRMQRLRQPGESWDGLIQRMADWLRSSRQPAAGTADGMHRNRSLH